MIVGSLLVTAGAVLLGVPIGVLTAIFLVYFCSKGLYTILKPSVNVMAGIPSIVYGFFGLQLIVPWIRTLDSYLWWHGLECLISHPIIGHDDFAYHYQLVRNRPTSYFKG